MTFHEQIKQEMALNPKMRGRDLAKKLGCSETYVSIVRNGRRDGRGPVKRAYFGNMKKIRAAYLWGQDWGVPEISEEIYVPVDMIIVFLQKEGLT